MSNGDKESLAEIGLLEGLDDGTLTALEKRCRWRRYATNETIIDSDSDTRDVYFVVDGRVRIVNHSLAGREISFAEVEPGGHFGDLSAIDGRPRSASVVALTSTLVASLSPEAFIELLKSHPDSAITVIRDLAQILERAEKTEHDCDPQTAPGGNVL